MARLSDLPVFPLPLVLLPGELLPLHIFEPRYRELVARCLAGPEPFCVVLEDDDGHARDRLPGARSHRARAARRRPPQHRRERWRAGAARADRRGASLLPERRRDRARGRRGARRRGRDGGRSGRLPRASWSEIGREDAEPLSAQPRLLLRARRPHRRGPGGRAGAARVALGECTPRAHHGCARAGPPQPARGGRARARARCATARSIRPSENVCANSPEISCERRL